MSLAVWAIHNRACNMIKNMTWTMCITLIHSYFCFHKNTMPQVSEYNITAIFLSQKKKKKGRDIFELFCHKSIFFEVSERASSAVYEHIRMRKCLGDARRRSLQESSAKTVSLLQPFWRAEILRTEAKDQIKVVYISFIQGSWLLLHLTIMEFFICWERLNWLYAKTVVWIFL